MKRFRRRPTERAGGRPRSGGRVGERTRWPPQRPQRGASLRVLGALAAMMTMTPLEYRCLGDRDVRRSSNWATIPRDGGRGYCGWKVWFTEECDAEGERRRWKGNQLMFISWARSINTWNMSE